MPDGDGDIVLVDLELIIVQPDNIRTVSGSATQEIGRFSADIYQSSLLENSSSISEGI